MKFSSAKTKVFHPAIIFSFLFILFLSTLQAQIAPASDRRPDEGKGPFERLIIRGAILIDGDGSPAYGPVDIVIEKNRIARVVSVGYPGVPIDENRRPKDATYELDASGMYVLPGFVDTHGLDEGSKC